MIYHINVLILVKKSINQFPTNVPLIDAPGNWFLLPK